jgi:hypothetical protein
MSRFKQFYVGEQDFAYIVYDNLIFLHVDAETIGCLENGYDLVHKALLYIRDQLFKDTPSAFYDMSALLMTNKYILEWVIFDENAVKGLEDIEKPMDIFNNVTFKNWNEILEFLIFEG